jgi:hypothetical protein
LKYQTLEAPDGLFLHVTGCFDGKRGNGYILQRSGLIIFLRENDSFNGFFVLGDSVYPNNDVIVSVYRGRNLPLAAQAINMVMCPIRTCIEWGYAKIVPYWLFIDLKNPMKVRGAQVEAYWHVSAFLTNVILCARGSNEISMYFDLLPPTLELFLDETMNAYRNGINNNKN